MSEKLLKALMQLFAIIADVDELTNNSKTVVQNFLKQQLNQEMVNEYLRIYDEYLEVHHKLSKKKDGKRKRTSVNSVKVLRICTQINTELEQKQKVVVLIRIIEYVNSDENITEQELEFITTVAESFNINKEEFDGCLDFITCKENTVKDSENLLVVDNKKETIEATKAKHLTSETLKGKLVVFSIESVAMFVLRYFGEDELQLNGQLITPYSTSYILTQGSSIRSSKVHPIYYSDIISKFLSDKSNNKIVFSVENIEYKFKGGKIGLHPLKFAEESGKLLGVMGGSGAGKSTLLNVLNSNNNPSAGYVKVNGIDIHHDKDKIEGVIGYVSQDDLLIEELTVFQNLFYNSKLCFDGLNDEKITTKVMDLLNSIGLYETRNLKVGSPLDKTISGGQRKRLNIALELIREPSVLFVDEPTSGLSSRDSENIMDLLKELALKGKVVFVVIHQPSSEIFKMFDKLLILDVGGYPIYYGNPVDAIIYFKEIVKHVKSGESECFECGNVNPEQIFNIIESKVLDEYGNLTDHRKISPKEWNELYQDKLVKNIHLIDEKVDSPKSTFNIPSKWKQFKVFITRDVLSKLTNSQYMFINMLEAPVLAFVLAFLVKYFNMDIENDKGYIFRENINLVAYMFMSVVVALFIGLTVSAEEIIRDQKIRKRESFLNLSTGSYLASKIIIMFVLSAIQTFTFVLIGNWLLEIRGMWVDYWLILFSTACFANMLGLNISSAFNSAVTIYILIPFLIIPQLLLSGVIVKFDKLNPYITEQTYVPFIGEIMASRWAFEALAVNQYKNNEFEKQFYKLNKTISSCDFKKNMWVSEMNKEIGIIQNHYEKEDKKIEVTKALELVINEIEKELKITGKKIPFKLVDELKEKSLNPKLIRATKNYIEKVRKFYMRRSNRANDKKDELIGKLQITPELKEKYNQIKDNYENENLSDLVRNRMATRIQKIDGNLIQRADPVYLDSKGFRSHFFAPRKKIFNRYYNTYSVNVLVLWGMSLVLMIFLYFDVFRKILNTLEKISSKLTKKVAF